jgi:hypothetical protein
MAKKSNECVYCGQPATTVDHVPPKCMFGEKKPSNLITVPACEPCNVGASKDDQYMQRLALVAGADAHTVGKQVNEAFLRAIERPQQKGMRAAFFQSLRPVNLATEGGLFAGRGFEFILDLDRLEGVLRRVVRGLFWKHFGRRLADGYETLFLPVMTDPRLPVAFRNNQQRIFDFDTVDIGGGAFVYRYCVAPGDENATIWRFDFFKAIGFMGYTAKAEDNGDLKCLLIADRVPEETRADTTA